MFPFTPSLVTAECPGWPLTQLGGSKVVPKIFKLRTRGHTSPSWLRLLDVNLDDIGDQVIK